MRDYRGALVALVLALAGVLGMPNADTVAVAAAQPTPVVSPAYPVRGVSFTVSGTLTTKVARPVRLEQLVGSTWTALASGTTSSSGKYSLKASSTSATENLRVVADSVKVGKKSYAKVVSRTRAVRTLSVVPSVPMVGEKFTVSDRLTTKATPVRPVELQRKVGKSWRTIVSGGADASGAFSLDVAKAEARMSLRVLAKKIRVGKKTYDQILTPVAEVVAVPQSVVIAAPDSVEAKRAVAVTLTFTPSRAGRPADVECLVAGQWSSLGARLSGTDGKATFEHTPAGEGWLVCRGGLAAWNGLPALTTPMVAVHITAAVASPTSLAVTTGDQVGLLEPGGPAVTVPFTVTNTGEAPVELTGVAHVALADRDGVAWVPPVGCEAGAYHASATITGGATTLQPGGNVDGVVTISMDNLPTSQDACKGATLPLHISVL